MLYMNSISFSLSPHPIFLLMTSLSHKYKRLRDLFPLSTPLPTSWTLPLLISLISKMKGFLYSMLVFQVVSYNTYYFTTTYL